MPEPGYFGDRSVIAAMSAEHRYLWRSLFRACEPLMKPGMRVMDFGCGDGGMLAYLMLGDGRGGGGWPGWSCGPSVGIDLPAMEPVLAGAAGRLGPALPVLFSCAAPDAFPGQFDLVLSHEVIYLLPDLAGTFRGLHACLRSGGAAALATGCHVENELYARWREAFARVGVGARPYGLADYTRALAAAGFDAVETRSLRLSVDDYEEWVRARAEKDPNPSWFADADQERRYYTEIGKALILGRRTART